ncbi:hypothetical protein AB0J74_05735 [Asanoa sp. NPDC049573]|uniref:hypothetical protein n=1 Tax=Asanoa sp. NPDC049573 TaxID=3155396 RepID=UPI003432169D
MSSRRRAFALLRALAAGLIAAGVMVLVVTIPSMGAGATGPGGVAVAFDPGADPGGDGGEPDPGATEPDAPPTVAEPTEQPTEEPTVPPPPTDPETEQPTGEATTDPEPTTAPPVQPTGGPGPTIKPPGQPGPVLPGQRPQLGALVWTSDITLGRSYWSRSSSATDLRVTVANTGSIVERVAMRYTLPVGVTDAGTPGCSLATGRTYVCGSWIAGPGLRFSASIRVRVAGDAWRKMPLGGSVDVTAGALSRPDLGTVTDNQGFAVLFPPGPPVAGISLAASEVAFGSPTQPANLEVRLSNTGDGSPAGSVEVLLPDGVTVVGQPSGCRAAGPRTHCDLGRLRGGQTATTTLPLVATLEAQRLAPLSGAVFGTLTSGRGTKQMQMSFRITAAEATATPSPTPEGAIGPTASQGTIGGFAPVAGSRGGLSGVQKTALALVVVSVLLVVLAITLATTSLRRRIEDDSTTALDMPAVE